jgi:hypothetical protein
MNLLFEAALEAQGFAEARGWRSCIIGGLAVIRWGQPRATQDVDISLFAGFGSEEHYIDGILGRFAERIENARAFALKNRVLLCRAANGVALDIALAGFPIEEQIIQRATPYEYAPGVRLITAGAEDLLILKAFAGRDQDWADVRGIVERQGANLHWGHIVQELTVLAELKGEPETLDRLDQIRQESRN